MQNKSGFQVPFSRGQVVNEPLLVQGPRYLPLVTKIFPRPPHNCRWRAYSARDGHVGSMYAIIASMRWTVLMFNPQVGEFALWASGLTESHTGEDWVSLCLPSQLATVSYVCALLLRYCQSMRDVSTIFWNSSPGNLRDHRC